jgi:hypothetical protein
MRKFVVDNLLPVRIVERIKRNAHLAPGERKRIISFKAYWHQNASTFHDKGTRRERRALGKAAWKAYCAAVKMVRQPEYTGIVQASQAKP